jgi:lipopolysaccharide export LptBFGC system permease protein LptF
VVPRSNKKAERIWDTINDVPSRSYNVQDRRWVLGKNRDRIYHFAFHNPASSTFHSLSIYDLDFDSGLFKRRIRAETGSFEGNDLLLNKSWVREFEVGAPSRYEERDRMRLTLAEDQSYFLQKRKIPRQMNFNELRKHIREMEERGFVTRNDRINLHHKFAFPLTCLIMTLIGVSFAFSMGKRGALVGIGFGLFISMIYWGGIGIFKSLGYINILSPVLAAWGPHILFCLSGLYLIFTIRT